MEENYLLGIDYGTDSVRSVIVSSRNGEEIASSVFQYPRWNEGRYCRPEINQFRQHPKDYIEGLQSSVRGCLKEAGEAVRKNIRGIGIDTTGSTPVAVNESGQPLALSPEFADNPNAMFVLWKDHTSIKEAEEINRHAQKFDTNYIKYVGGVYSSEWFWAKLLHILRQDEAVRKACYSWVEHCDWIPFLLTGGKQVSEMKRSRCAAGHKALWSESFGGLPPNAFFSSLDPLLDGFTERLYKDTYTADLPVGTLSEEWAETLGLSTEVIVCGGAFDSHMGAVGGQIEPYFLSKVMGTSTCDMLVAPVKDIQDRQIKGIAGQVHGSVIPGMIGMEAGQSAFGDVYAWFSKILQWPVRNLIRDSGLLSSDVQTELEEKLEQLMIPALSRAASEITLSEDSELALDWLNGRRTPFANQRLKGAVSNLNLGSNPATIFHALAESTCFGAKKIVDCFKEQQIEIRGLIGLGGVAKKSPFVMQMMADVMDMPIKIHRAEQTVAMGAAMFAATASGIFPKVEEAMQVMGLGFEKEYQPNQEKTGLYRKRYEKYKAMGGFVEGQLTVDN